MKKTFILLFLVAFILIILIIFFSLKSPSPSEPAAQSNNSSSLIPTPIPLPFTRASLIITSVNPSDKSQNIPLNTDITITFNRPFNLSEVYFSIAPHTGVNISVDKNILIITPQQRLLDGTTYSYIVFPNKNPQGLQTITFSTKGIESNQITDTRPYHISEDEDAYDLTYRPDLYLTNKTPYSTSNFTVQSTFQKSTKSEFLFIVNLLGNNKTVDKQSFLTWLISLGLTSDQINNKLVIKYQ